MSGSSTESVLSAMVSRLEETVAEGQFSLAIFLDIQIAFKSVSFNALDLALRNGGVYKDLTGVISSIQRH